MCTKKSDLIKLYNDMYKIMYFFHSLPYPIPYTHITYLLKLTYLIVPFLWRGFKKAFCIARATATDIHKGGSPVAEIKNRFLS